MKRLTVYFLFLFITILLAGCGRQAVALHKQGTYQYKNSTIELSKKVRKLDISVDSGKLQIFCWDKPEITCEIKHTVRDKKTDEQLQKLLNKFSVKSTVKDNICYISVDYDGNIKNSNDIFSEVKLTIPRRINSIELVQEQGSLVVEDKFEGSIKAELEAASAEIKALYGSMLIHCENGNFRLNSGRLTRASEVKIEKGNIYVKAECEGKSTHSFETRTGNIELTFPVTAAISLDTAGTISHNQFTGSEGDIKVNASTKFGKLSINGYIN